MLQGDKILLQRPDGVEGVCVCMCVQVGGMHRGCTGEVGQERGGWIEGGKGRASKPRNSHPFLERRCCSPTLAWFSSSSAVCSGVNRGSALPCTCLRSFPQSPVYTGSSVRPPLKACRAWRSAGPDWQEGDAVLSMRGHGRWPR